MLEPRSACTVALFAAALAVTPPTATGLREFGRWFVRPARLPFAWQALATATRSGDGREAFARGQQILQLLPSWTDGHAAFAYRYALTSDASADRATTARRAEQRLQIALAYLEEARRHASRRELDLLQAGAFLPQVACNQFPGLAERLQPSAAELTDAWLAEAERVSPSAAVREQRLWFTPRLAAALLGNDDASGAMQVIRTALDQVDGIRERQLAAEWAARLREVLRWLQGDRAISLDAVFADPRFEPLWPFLH
ncbi:MAG TPA: hypothetical protein ENI87_08550 [bacterium]|nr:hypothetical protein [bacterium]